MSKHTDIDKLPFAEYAELMVREGAKKRGLSDASRMSFSQLAASDMTFDQIEAKYGEETAINVGIARDPDTVEADAGWFKRARPAIEVMPHLVESWRRVKAGEEELEMKVIVTIELDADLVERLEETGPDWKERINDTLRKAVLRD